MGKKKLERGGDAFEIQPPRLYTLTQGKSKKLACRCDSWWIILEEIQWKLDPEYFIWKEAGPKDSEKMVDLKNIPKSHGKLCWLSFNAKIGVNHWTLPIDFIQNSVKSFLDL